MGDHLVCVRSTYDPDLKTRMWKWSGNIIVDYGLGTGPQSVYVYGNYEEKMNVEESVGYDDNVYYEVNIEEPFGSANDYEVFYEVNDEEISIDRWNTSYEQDLDETGLNTLRR